MQPPSHVPQGWGCRVKLPPELEGVKLVLPMVRRMAEGSPKTPQVVLSAMRVVEAFLEAEDDPSEEIKKVLKDYSEIAQDYINFMWGQGR